MITIEEVIKDKLKEHLAWNDHKIEQWLDTENDALGGITPKFMLVNNRAQKLLEFVTNQLNGDIP